MAYVTNSSALDHTLESILRHELFRLKSMFFILMDTHKLLYGPKKEVVVAHFTSLL
jgi:hypothetical protein